MDICGKPTRMTRVLFRGNNLRLPTYLLSLITGHYADRSTSHINEDNLDAYIICRLTQFSLLQPPIRIYHIIFYQQYKKYMYRMLVPNPYGLLLRIKTLVDILTCL